jgi:hypothetical protein
MAQVNGFTTTAVRITVNMGNDRMKNAHDLAGALRDLADRLDAGQQALKVMDQNGNSVGDVDYL